MNNDLVAIIKVKQTGERFKVLQSDNSCGNETCAFAQKSFGCSRRKHLPEIECFIGGKTVYFLKAD